MNLQEADMAKRNEIFPSKYLKASDLAGKPPRRRDRGGLRPKRSAAATTRTKTVLHFRGGPKALAAQYERWDSVAIVAGDDTDLWPGHRVELFPTKTEMKGKVVDCIRIRAPQQKERKPKAGPAVPPTDDDMDDHIPF